MTPSAPFGGTSPDTSSFASVYPLYLAKAEKKGRSRSEVDEIIRWLMGYGPKELGAQLKKRTDFGTFLARAPRLNPPAQSPGPIHLAP